jgi:hypothetical protein
LLGPGQGLVGEVTIGFGARHFGLQLLVVDSEQRLSLGHFGTFPHQDLDQSSLNLGAELDLLQRLDLSGRADGVDHRVLLRHGCLNRHRGSAAPCARTFISRGRALLVAGRQGKHQEGHQDQTHHKPSPSRSGNSRWPRILSSPASASRLA